MTRQKCEYSESGSRTIRVHLVICIALETIGRVLGVLFKLNSHFIEQIVFLQIIANCMRQAQVCLIDANMNGTNYTIL